VEAVGIMSRDILLTEIRPDPDQPRKYFDPESLAELAASISEHGLAVPILLRPDGEGYIIVHGERRYKAVQSLGWEAIPAEIRDMPTDQARWLSLIENIQREDLTPIEEAQEYRRILAAGITQAELGERIGKTQSYIAHKVSLLKLPDPLRYLLSQNAITEGHTRQLQRLKGIYKGTTSDQTGWLDYEPKNIIEIGALPFMVALRPLDQLPINVYEGDHVIINTIKAYSNYVIDQGGIIPAWTRAAVWFGCVAYLHSLPVTELKDYIDLFTDIIYSGVWYSITGKPPESYENYYELKSARYYGYMSDLRHAGIDSKNQNTELRAAVGVHILEKNYFTEPSTLQPWGRVSDKVKKQLEASRSAMDARRL
jgi:ParB/RepB/Spo0J family partition protein